MTFVITIVHGTQPFKWFTDRVARLVRRATDDAPPWTRSDSSLCTSLGAGLPGDVVFSSFPWSGANSARARWLAATDLQQHLEKLMVQYPSGHHFVIAHSHGGNVALHALNSDRIKQQLKGIVCLSTPFIVVVDRAGWLTPAFVAFLYLGALVGVAALLGVWFAYDQLVSFTPLSLLVYVAILPVAASILTGLLFPVALKAAESWKQRITLPDLTWLGRDRLLIIKGVGDEANSFLAAAQFVAWGGGRVTRGAALWLSLTHTKMERPFRNWKSRPLKLIRAAGSNLVFLFMTMLAGLLLSPIIALVTCASFATWGARLGALSPFIELSAESTPPGTWQITQLEGYHSGSWTDWLGTELRTTAHSTIYSDARAASSIVDWMAPNGTASDPGTDHPDSAAAGASIVP